MSFLMPKAPAAIQPAPPPPAQDPNALAQQDAQALAAARRAAAGGRASTQLTGPLGDPNTPTATHVLLGM